MTRREAGEKAAVLLQEADESLRERTDLELVLAKIRLAGAVLGLRVRGGVFQVIQNAENVAPHRFTPGDLSPFRCAQCGAREVSVLHVVPCTCGVKPPYSGATTCHLPNCAMRQIDRSGAD